MKFVWFFFWTTVYSHLSFCSIEIARQSILPALNLYGVKFRLQIALKVSNKTSVQSNLARATSPSHTHLCNCIFLFTHPDSTSGESPSNCPFPRGSDFYKRFVGHSSLLLKRHLDRFSRVCTTHRCFQHTGTQTTLHAKCVGSGRIHALHAGDASQ